MIWMLLWVVELGVFFGFRGIGELCVMMVIVGVKLLVCYCIGDVVWLVESDCDCELFGDWLDVVGCVFDWIELGG